MLQCWWRANRYPPSPVYWSLDCLFNLSTDRISWSRVRGLLPDKTARHPLVFYTKLLHSNRKINPVSTNVWSILTLLVKCRVEWEQNNRGREDKSPIFCGDTARIFTNQAWIVELLRRLHVILLSHCKRGLVQTSRRESQRASLRVTQFTSSSQDTLQQLALQELLCNYQQQQQGKCKKGQTLCHPMGEYHSQFQCLKCMI